MSEAEPMAPIADVDAGFNPRNIRDHIKTEIEAVLSERAVPSAPPAVAVAVVEVAPDTRSTYQKVNEWLGSGFTALRQRMREPLFITGVLAILLVAHFVASHFGVNFHSVLNKIFSYGITCYMMIMMVQVMGDAGSVLRRRP